MKNDTITFIDNRSGKKHNFTIKKGSSGPDVVDLTSFFSKTGCLFTIQVSHQQQAVLLKLHI